MTSTAHLRFPSFRRMRAAALTSLGLLTLVAHPTRAQTAPPPRITPQEVIVTATLAPLDRARTAQTVTVITREELERLGLRSIIEALRLVPGVDVRARGPRDVQTDFSIRGATFGQHAILADGFRLNDSQSGHHNGEIPLPAIAIDRIEIVSGAGSAVHGADALGGTINVISRRGAHALASVMAGEHGFADVQASTSGGPLSDAWALSGWTSRSSGFMFDRDFAIGGLALRGSPVSGLTLDVRHQRRAFGANGFYGASPSKEWTDQTLVGTTWQRDISGWQATTRVLVRHHGDHFRWDINRPGFAENRHRTNAVEGSVALSRRIRAATLTVGGSGGRDAVESSNLGNHDYSRGSIFAELQAPLADRASLTTAVRVDRYTTFGRSVSPSLSAAAHLSDAVRVRASVAHAFRIPTYTERYYSDPANLGSPDLVSEHGWTLDGGLDWTRQAWTSSVSIFRRWDEDVIDWVRATSTDRWSSTNVRDVRARGVETSLGRRWEQALVRVHFAGLHVDAPTLPLLSKYVLEYARHQAGVSLAVPTVAGVRLSVNVDHRRRRDGQAYELVSARVSRAFGRIDAFVDGTNLFNQTYHEIVGVQMPGRWLTAGLTVR
jgi:outer membrane cobalamin receptor